MKKFILNASRLQRQAVRVEADSPQEAYQKARAFLDAQPAKRGSPHFHLDSTITEIVGKGCEPVEHAVDGMCELCGKVVMETPTGEGIVEDENGVDYCQECHKACSETPDGGETQV